MSQNIHCEKLLGIEIFEWANWDEAFEQILVFYDVNFKFPSLQQYNGMDVNLDRSWSIFEVIDENGTVVKSINLFEVPEFIDIIRNLI